jgi:hypothetical protein
MITEDYVSFETAKLLKEKGFDEMTELAYGLEHGHIRNDLPVSYWRNSEIGEYKFSCPTLQMTMKWLREVHNIHISVYVFNRELPITNVPIFYTCDIATEKLSSQQGHLRGAWKSYEEACEAAIKYCLENLI